MVSLGFLSIFIYRKMQLEMMLTLTCFFTCLNSKLGKILKPSNIFFAVSSVLAQYFSYAKGEMNRIL